MLEPFAILVLLAIVAPLVALSAIGLMMLLRPNLTAERAVVRVTSLSLTVSFVACSSAAVVAALSEVSSKVAHLTWFQVGEYSFDFGVLADLPALVMMVLVSAVTGLIGRFSVHYLHRDPGFSRFFLLLNLFSFGMLMLVTSASVDQLFLGWEIVGVTSALLVAYFHLRRAPVAAGLRVFITYRLCDIGFLFGAVLLHLFSGTTEFVHQTASTAQAHAGDLTVGQATAVGLCFLVGAIGKAAQMPTGGWLPRAMEGPTPSSALFYGALSVHAGVFLLIRAYPLLAAAPIAAGAVVAVGAFTAMHASVVVRAQTDAKNTLAYATMAQVGLMFVEVGLGFTGLALIHLVAHVCLRALQFLRTPSALKDAFSLRAALGKAGHPAVDLPTGEAPHGMRVLVYQLALERFHVDTMQQRFIVGPLLAISRGLGAVERRLSEVLGGATDEPEPAALDLEAPEAPEGAGRR